MFIPPTHSLLLPFSVKGIAANYITVRFLGRGAVLAPTLDVCNRAQKSVYLICSPPPLAHDDTAMPLPVADPDPGPACNSSSVTGWHLVTFDRSHDFYYDVTQSA